VLGPDHTDSDSQPAGPGTKSEPIPKRDWEKTRTSICWEWSLLALPGSGSLHLKVGRRTKTQVTLPTARREARREAQPCRPKSRTPRTHPQLDSESSSAPHHTTTIPSQAFHSRFVYTHPYVYDLFNRFSSFVQVSDSPKH
jgi:hypothetical protein